MMKLHVFPGSPRARKALTVAYHLDLPIEVAAMDPRTGAHKRPEFLKLNPNGRIPVLEEDDFALWESNAIIQHLAEKKPGVLTPTDAKGRIQMAQWLAWDLAHWDSAWVMVIFETVVKQFLGRGEPDPARIKEGRERLDLAAKVLDGQLANKEFVLGDKLTVVDFALAAPLSFAAMCQVSLEPYPHIARWFRCIEATEAWQKVPGLPVAA